MSFLRQIRYLTLRSIRSRFSHYLLSVFGIILGVAVMLGMRVTNQAALDSIVELFADTSGRSKLMIRNSNLEESGFPEKFLWSATNTAGVGVAAPTLEEYTVATEDVPVDQIALTFFGSPGESILLHGIDPVLDIRLHDYRMTAGNFLDNDPNAREVVLVEGLADELDLEVGDWLSLLTPNGIEELKVIGLMKNEGPGQANLGRFGVAPLQTLQELFDRDGELDQIDILTTNPNPSSEELEALREKLRERLGEEVTVSYPANQGERMTQQLGAYQIGLNFLSIVALFVGAFLIYNAFAMTVVERTREFGMLRTIGMSRGQVTLLVLTEAGLLGVIGSVLGVGLGILLAKGLSGMMGSVLSQNLSQISYAPADLVMSGVVGMGVTFVAAGIPAYQAGRISPMEALRIRAKTKESWLIRRGWMLGILLLAVSIPLLAVNPFPYEAQFSMGSLTIFGILGGATLLIPVTVSTWERLTRPLIRAFYGGLGGLGSRNIRRSRQRTTLTVAALMVGVAIVIMTRGITISFKADLNIWIDSYLGGDLLIGSNVGLRSDLADRIATVDGVEAITPIRYFDAGWRTPDGEDAIISIRAVDPGTFTQVSDFVFADEDTDAVQVMRRLQEGGAVLISSVITERYGLQPGDNLLLRTSSGWHEFKIAGVVIDYFNQGLTLQTSWNDMRRWFRINDASAFMVRVAEGYSADAVEERIDDLYGQRNWLVIESNLSFRQRIQVLVDQIFAFFDVTSLIAVVVAAFGIVNTLTQSVLERMQEIGMLRAVGMARSQVLKMILAEALLIGIIGDVLGVVTGVLLGNLLVLGIGTMTGYEISFSMPVGDALASAGAAFVISQLAAIFPARRAARVRILDAVQYE